MDNFIFDFEKLEVYKKSLSFADKLFNPNFAIELPACSADRQNSHEVPPVAGLTPLTPKRCVAARRADFSNEKSGFKLLKSCPMEIRFTVAEHLCKTGIQILNNIAEGSGNTGKSKKQFYGYALNSARECIPMLSILSDQKIIKPEEYTAFRNECISICQMLAKLIVSVKTKNEE